MMLNPAPHMYMRLHPTFAVWLTCNKYQKEVHRQWKVACGVSMSYGCMDVYMYV